MEKKNYGILKDLYWDIYALSLMYVIHLPEHDWSLCFQREKE